MGGIASFYSSGQDFKIQKLAHWRSSVDSYQIMIDMGICKIGMHIVFGDADLPRQRYSFSGTIIFVV